MVQEKQLKSSVPEETTSQRNAEMRSKEHIAGLLNHFDDYKSKGYAWYVYRLFHPTVNSAIPFLDAGMQPYFPTVTVTTHDSHGRERKVEKPKFLNYLFALATKDQVHKLHTDSKDHTQPVLKHRVRFSEDTMEQADTNNWQTVGFREMNTLIRFTEAHDDTVSLVMADDELLEKGDKVRVINGPLKGSEGILRTSQGRKGGTIFFTITSMISTDKFGNETSVPYVGLETVHISEKDIKVIAFNPQNNHFYKKLSAFEKVLQKAIAKRDTLITDQKLIGKMQLFIKSYDELQNLSGIYATKRATLFYVASTLLNDEEAIHKYGQQIPPMESLPKTMQEYVSKWRKAISI